MKSHQPIMFDNVIMPLLPPGERHLTWKLIKVWLYRACFIGSVLLLIGFAAVLPIDSIAQASVSDNNALNTFIVVGAIVVFFIICVIIIIGRLIYRKSCLVDIPRRYLPVTSADLPHHESREYILQNMDRSKEMGIFFKKPKDPVVHDGLEPPLRCDVRSNYHITHKTNNNKRKDKNNNSSTIEIDGSINKIFPEFLNYETCMKVVSNRIKYQGFFLSVINLELETQDTFGDIMKKQFIIGNDASPVQVTKAKRFINLYQYLQYSGKSIKREDFIEFVELSIYFADIIATSDQSLRADNNVDTLTKLNTKSNQSLRYRNNGMIPADTTTDNNIADEDDNTTNNKRQKWNNFKFETTEDYKYDDIGPAVDKHKGNPNLNNNINYDISDEDDDMDPSADRNGNYAPNGDDIDPAADMNDNYDPNNYNEYPSVDSSLRNVSQNSRPLNEGSGTDTDFAADAVSYFPSVPSFVRRHNSTGSVARRVRSNRLPSFSSYSSSSNTHSLNALSKKSQLSDEEVGQNITNGPDDTDISKIESLNSVVHHT